MPNRKTDECGKRAAYRLTTPQMGVWLEHQLIADRAFHNIAEFLRIRGPLDTSVFAEALQFVVDGTEALRIRIASQGDSPTAEMVSHVLCGLKVVDLRQSEHADMEARQWMEADMRRPFAMDGGPLFRFALLRVRDDCSLWYYKYHHVVMDGAAMALVAGRVADSYTALKGKSDLKSAPDLAWASVVGDDIAYAASPQKERDRDFWLAHCRDLPPPISLSPRAGFTKEPGAACRTSVPLPRSLISQLRQLAETVAGCRLSHVLYALLHVYVARLTGTTDVAISVPRANRAKGPARNTAGMFTNVTVPRVQFPSTGSLRDLIAHVAAILKRTRSAREVPPSGDGS